MKIFKLKIKVFLTSIIALSLFAFSGCLFLLFDQEENYKEYYADDDDTDYVKTLASANTITLNNVKNKIILYANYNKDSSKEISKEYLRYLQSSAGLNTSSNIISTRSAGCQNQTEDTLIIEEKTIKHFIPKNDMGKAYPAGERSLSVQKPSFSKVNANSFSIGDTKSLYVDTNSAITEFTKKTATLYAKNSICLVWIVSGYFTENSASGKYVNKSVAEHIASEFAKLYNHERTVFGEEGEYLIHQTGPENGYVSDTLMQDGDSPTGSLINIVLYDIGNDYADDNSNSTVGYFYSKDYWIPSSNSTTYARYSNIGKYFYIDSSFCNYISSKSSSSNKAVKYAGVKDSSNKSIASDTALSTLFHEFQHMINYNQKDYGEVETWYNEMLSMLAEDMFATNLNLNQDDTPWGAHLPSFNTYYFVSGIDEYRKDALEAFSYSTVYTFGAWLAREFGGPEFISLISKNKLTGMESIRDAIYKSTGENISANQLRRRFIQSCVFRNDFALAHDIYTLNKDAGGQITDDGFTSIMNAIDIFSEDYASSDDPFDKQLGPAIYGNYSYPTSIISNGTRYTLSDLRPHGFQIHYAGLATSDTVTLNFTKQKNSNEDVIIFIQDKFDNSTY